ncbi:MAG: hypothetical protein ACYDES_11035 [Acidimicrobiales bacterium]
MGPDAITNGRSTVRYRARIVVAGMALLLSGCVLSACGSSLANIVGTTSTSSPPRSTTTSTTTPGPRYESGAAVAFPVVACASGSGASPTGWHPSVLLAPIATALVGKVEFYSDGTHSIVGPSGWACSRYRAPGGVIRLDVTPQSGAAPPTAGTVPPGTQGIFAEFATTGTPEGVGLVCRYFAVPAWQQAEGACGPGHPAGEQSSMPTPDIASITDPSGVIGTLVGSGGTQPVLGTVIFPQSMPAVADGSSVAVAKESCSLTDTLLCTTILSDFDVREFPVPGSAAFPAASPPSGTSSTSSTSATAPAIGTAGGGL